MPKPLCLLLLALLTGCTAASTHLVSANTAVINASDSEGSTANVQRKALKTAALAARAHGYEYFGIVDRRDGMHASTNYMPGMIGAGCSPQPCAGGGTVGLASDLKTMRGAETEITVRFLHANELPANRDGIYPVAAVLASQT